jgi:SAM-dependent methyltransferase
MNCFKLVKTVLDDLYDEISEMHEYYSDNTIKSKLDYLQKNYETLNDANSANIDYNDPATRFAYVYRYTTAHANIVFQLIRDVSALRDTFGIEKLNVSCLGGGPGSDILGVLKFVDFYNDISSRLKKLTFTICDKEQTWNETWYNIDSKIEASAPFSASYHFLSVDVTEIKALRFARKISDADLLTMIYFISEIYAYRDDARNFFEHLFNKAKPGALLLFVDNSCQTFYNWLDEIAAANRLEVVEKKDYFFFQTEADEDKEALGDYYNKFKYPKLKAEIAYRIYRKEDDWWF